MINGVLGTVGGVVDGVLGTVGGLVGSVVNDVVEPALTDVANLLDTALPTLEVCQFYQDLVLHSDLTEIRFLLSSFRT